MSKVVRISDELIPKLNELDNDINKAIEKLLETKPAIGLNLTDTQRGQLTLVNKSNLSNALDTVLMFFFNRTDLNQARLSEIQKQEVELIFQKLINNMKGY